MEQPDPASGHVHAGRRLRRMTYTQGIIQMFEDEPGSTSRDICVRAIKRGSRSTCWPQQVAIDRGFVCDSTAVAVGVVAVASRVLTKQSQLASIIDSAGD